MNWSNVWTIFRTNWLQTFRNRTTLVIIALVLISQPVLITVAAKLIESRISSSASIEASLVLVGDDAEWVGAKLAGSPQLCSVPLKGNDLKSALSTARRRGALVLQIPQSFRAKLEEESADVPELVLYRSSDRDTIYEQQIVDRALDSFRARYAGIRMQHLAVPKEISEEFDLDIQSSASNESRTGAGIGLVLPMEIILVIVLVALYCSTDLVTAERERGTLVLLAVSPVAPREILMGKVLVVALSATAAAIILLALQLGLLHLFIHRAADVAGQYDLAVPFLGALLAVPLLLPLAAMASCISITIAAYARSFQQAQSYFSLLMFFFVVPAVVTFLPTSDYPPVIAIVPFANVSLAVRDLMTGQADWLFCGAAALSSCFYAFALFLLSCSWLKSEHAIFPHDEPLGTWRSTGRMVITFLLLVFLGYFVVGQALQGLNTVIGLVAAQVLIIAGPVFPFLIWLRIPVRSVLSIGKPAPSMLAGAALLAPATCMLACCLMAVQDKFLPAPQALEELMLRVLLPPGTPVWVAYVTAALTPAVCEEILFRGLLMGVLLRTHSIRSAFTITALTFGLFHMSAFRFVPTVLLGFILCWVAWRTGSIFPAMVLHFCHNSLALTLMLNRFDPFSWQNAAIATASALVALWILRRSGQRPAV